MIEEFMLLANYLVAQRLLEKVKSKAFLRCHPPPDPQGLEKLLDLAAVEGVDIKATTAGELQQSFERYYKDLVLCIISMLVLTRFFISEYITYILLILDYRYFTQMTQVSANCGKVYIFLKKKRS